MCCARFADCYEPFAMTASAHSPMVRFCVSFDGERFYGEPELAVPGTTGRAKAARTPDLEGALDIDTDVGAVRIADVLVPWIQNLCFGAVPALAQGSPVQIVYAASGGSIELTPRDGRIHLAGTRIPACSVPARPFLAALVACGDRFLDFANEVKREDREYLAQLVDLPRLRKAAAAALAKTD